MKQIIFSLIFVSLFTNAFSQSRFSSRELSINGFRNPSIGLEYRQKHLSVHAGYYLTALTAGVTSRFVKSGVTYWFLPVDKKSIPSSFYGGISYLYGLNLDYKNKNAIGLELGFRWMVWKGINLRLGAIALAAKGQDTKINPAPGISYSIKF